MMSPLQRTFRHVTCRTAVRHMALWVVRAIRRPDH